MEIHTSTTPPITYFSFLVISTVGEICLFEEISPSASWRIEMTALMQLSDIFTFAKLKLGCHSV